MRKDRVDIYKDLVDSYKMLIYRITGSFVNADKCYSDTLEILNKVEHLKLIIGNEEANEFLKKNTLGSL